MGDGLAAAHSAYRVKCKDIDDLIILAAFINLPPELFIQCPCEVLNLLLLFLRRSRLAGQAAGEGIQRLAEWLPAMLLIEEEVWDGDCVRDIWELQSPCWRIEDHVAVLSLGVLIQWEKVQECGGRTLILLSLSHHLRVFRRDDREVCKKEESRQRGPSRLRCSQLPPSSRDHDA
jgi:hypothetical protein